MAYKEDYGEQLITTYQTIKFDLSNFLTDFITFTNASFLLLYWCQLISFQRP